MYLTTIITIIISKKLRHKFPHNYILLTIFTLSLSFVVSGLTAWLTFKSVLLAVGVLVITLSCLFLAALFIPAKPAVLKGIAIGVAAATLV